MKRVRDYGFCGRAADDIPTICAISIAAGILTNILHEGLGHGLVAVLTGAQSGVLMTVAWSSAFDSRLVDGNEEDDEDKEGDEGYSEKTCRSATWRGFCLRSSLQILTPLIEVSLAVQRK